MGAGAACTALEAIERERKKSTINILANDTKAMDMLFLAIAKHNTAAAAGSTKTKTKISLQDILTYFEDKPESALKQTFTNQEILIAAHKTTCLGLNTKSEDKSVYAVGLSSRQFRLLLSTLYMFSHLWTIFEIMDTSADNRISLDEYRRAKLPLSAVGGMEFIALLSDQNWVREFNTLDLDKNGWISFNELCLYVVKNIVHADAFLFGGADLVPDETDDEEDLGTDATTTAQSVSVTDAQASGEAEEKDEGGGGKTEEAAAASNEGEKAAGEGMEEGSGDVEFHDAIHKEIETLLRRLHTDTSTEPEPETDVDPSQKLLEDPGAMQAAEQHVILGN